ncbi:MAG: hypothetical protein LUD72_09075 [Bacteroidales bacterium]|nr:hypothetical protein [Bacteroidales bacterium]
MMTVEIPFAIGDTAYSTRNVHGTRTIRAGIVSEIYFSKDMKLCAAVRNVGRGPVGVKVFKTREEATGKEIRDESE